MTPARLFAAVALAFAGGFAVTAPAARTTRLPTAYDSTHVASQRTQIRILYNRTRAKASRAALAKIDSLETDVLTNGADSIHANAVRSQLALIRSNSDTILAHRATADTTEQDLLSHLATNTVAIVLVSPSAVSMGSDGSRQLTATVSDGNGNPVPSASVVWTTSNASIATVSQTGLVTAQGTAGTATITATANGVAGTATATVTVPAAPVVTTVLVRPTPDTLTAGGATVALTATPKDASSNVVANQSVSSWASSDNTVATVNGSGVVTPVAAGTATITATIASVQGTATIVVVAATVASVAVSPTADTLVAGAPGITITATGYDARGAVVPGAGATASWSSDNTGVATVGASTGAVVPIAAGTAHVSATINGHSASSTITVTAAVAAGVTLPQDSITVTTMPTVSRTVPVHSAAALQAAIDSASRGDKIVLDSGVTYQGAFVLKAKSGSVSGASGWITITSNGTCAAQGTRVTPADSVHMPRVIANSGNVSAFTVQAAASGYRLVCLNIGIPTTVTTQYAIVQLGDGSNAQNSSSLVPSYLVLDRSYVHGHSSLNVQRCVALHAAYAAVVESYLSECHYKGADAQAIGSWNGPGPYRIENNRLQGSGENLMFGGADPAITNQVSSDIIIRRNYLEKPAAWKGLWTVKNLFELKAAKRVLVEGNVFDGAWVDGQTGFALTWKSTNQSSTCTWCTTQDVTFRYNIVRNAAAGLTIAAHPEQYPVIPAARFLVEQNLFYEIGTYNGTSNGRMVMMLNPLTSVTLRQNTFVHNSFSTSGQWVIVDSSGGHATGLTLDKNVATWGGPYGAIMGNVTQGSATLAAYSPGYTYGSNTIISLPSNLRAYYPASTLFAALTTDVFVNPSAHDFHILGASASVGLGCDVDAVLAATNGVDQ